MKKTLLRNKKFIELKLLIDVYKLTPMGYFRNNTNKLLERS